MPLALPDLSPASTARERERENMGKGKGKGTFGDEASLGAGGGI
jgi:hypothetical protein